MFKKAKFIILKKIKYGESDLIIHALNHQGAKLGFIAKGALKSKKRFSGGVLDPTHYVVLMYKDHSSQSHTDKLYFLEEASLLNDFAGLRTSYDRLQTALYLLQVVDHVSLEGLIDAGGVFNLLGNSLKALQNATNISLLKTQFELKILQQQGVLPEEYSNHLLLKAPISESDHLFNDLNKNPVELKPFQIKVHTLLEGYIKSGVTL